MNEQRSGVSRTGDDVGDYSKGMSKSKMGLWNLGQGRWEPGMEQGRLGIRSSENGIKGQSGNGE